jgi:hypothetical protein
MHSAGDTIVANYSLSWNVSSLLAQFLDHLIVNKRNIFCYFLRLIPGNLLSARTTLNKTWIAAFALSSATALSFFRHVTRPPMVLSFSSASLLSPINQTTLEVQYDILLNHQRYKKIESPVFQPRYQTC